jgi:hypothetical protein
MFDLETIQRFFEQEIELYGDEIAVEKNSDHKSPDSPARMDKDINVKAPAVES